MTNPPRYYRINLEEIAARNETARHMIAGFSAEMPVLTDFWRNLDTALADNLELSAEVTWLIVELSAARLDRANLLAAIRATLAAYADGEATTSATNSALARKRPKAGGGPHDRLPADAPPRPPGPTRRHAAHDGHQLR